MSTFKGLENLEEEIVEGEAEGEKVDNIEEALELISMEDEVAEELDEIEKEEEAFVEGFHALESLQNLHDIIAEHGLCKSTMLAADPDGYLVTKLGLPAVETLDASPIKDANAQAAMEKISDTLGKWAEGVKKFFKWIWDKIVSLFKAVIELVVSKEKIIKMLTAKLKGVKIDPVKAAAKMVNIPSMKDITDMKGSVSHLVGVVTGLLKVEKMTGLSSDTVGDEIKKIAGIDKLDALGIKLNDKGTGFVSAPKDAPKAESKSVKDFGLTEALAADMLKGAADSIVQVRAADKRKAEIKATTDKAIAKAKSLGAMADDAKAKETKKEIEALKIVSSMVLKVLSKVVKFENLYINYAMKAASAVISCKA